MVGIVAGKFKYNQIKLLWLLQSLLKTTVVIYFLVFVYYVATDVFPFTASNPMFMLILGCFVLGIYFQFRHKKLLYIYFLLYLVPLISVTRMAILVYLLIIVLHFANRKFISKLIMGLISIILLIILVNSKSFKEKTYFNGEGDFFQSISNYKNDQNFNTNGRSAWEKALESGLRDSPWFGNGARADGIVIGELVGLNTYETHNDYLSLRYNYGIVGLTLFLMMLLLTFLKLLQIRNKKEESLLKIMKYSTLTLFLVLLMFMYSDNILKYSTWFTNYFFASIGICFSMYKKKYITNE